MIRILFVCMGNICRSPTAEGVFRRLVRDAKLDTRIDVDSAGTHTYHLGESPDPRAIEIASDCGVDISGLISRSVVELDFLHFDHILVMDCKNLFELKKIRLTESATEPRLLLDYAPGKAEFEIPDPYYGTLDDYRQAMKLINAGTRGLLRELQQRLEAIDSV
jgi:protein-tyrosine phosphatase